MTNAATFFAYFLVIGEVEYYATCDAPTGFIKVTAKRVGSVRDEEGTKAVWRDLPAPEQFLIDLKTMQPIHGDHPGNIA